VLADECLTAFYGHLLVGQSERGLAMNSELLLRPPDPKVERELAAGTDPFLWALHSRSDYLIYMGRLAEAEKNLEEALPLIAASDAREVQVWAYGTRAHLDYHSGEARGGVALARRGLETAEEVGSPTNRSFAMMNLSVGHMALGEFDQALPLCESVIETVESQAPGGRPWRPIHRGLLAQVLARLGDFERAVEVADEGIAMAAEQNIRGFASYPWYALALARIGQGRETEAEAAISGFAAALECTDVLALAPRVPECRAELARQRGDGAGYAQHLREAIDAYRAMDAHGHVRRLEALLEG
jgi:tetratricopeptide (TPR) repeat protein